jgi:uncharacterized protein YcfJ
MQAISPSSCRHRGRGFAKLKCSEIKAMKRQFLMFLALISAATAYVANDEAAKASYEAAKKKADYRYSEDQKICADESTSSRRMQCLRDAKDDHTKALAAAENKLAAESKTGPSAASCNDCGKVTGKDVATIAGAAGGAYAGHKIEGKMKSTKTCAVSVRFDNGDERTFNFDHDPGLAAGDQIMAAGSSIVRR